MGRLMRLRRMRLGLLTLGLGGGGKGQLVRSEILVGVPEAWLPAVRPDQ